MFKLISMSGKNLSTIVHELLLGRGLKLSTAESCTGGLIASMITEHSGSSSYYMGGAVTYSNELKTLLLDIDPCIFKEYGAVSPQCAEAMARGALSHFKTDLAISVTGIAGPTGGTPQKPVGLVYLGLASSVDGTMQVLEKRFQGTRSEIRQAAALTALEMLQSHLN